MSYRDFDSEPAAMRFLKAQQAKGFAGYLLRYNAEWFEVRTWRRA